MRIYCALTEDLLVFVNGLSLSIYIYFLFYLNSIFLREFGVCLYLNSEC